MSLNISTLALMSTANYLLVSSISILGMGNPGIF